MLGRNKKKFLSLSLSTICLLSMSAYAQYPSPRGVLFELEGFQGQATESLFTNLSYAVAPFEDLSTDAENILQTQFFGINSTYHTGYHFSIGYDFPSCKPCSNYGFSVEYTNFRQHDSASTPLFLSPDGLENPILISLTSGLQISSFRYSNASASFNMDYDTIDLLAHKNTALNCYSYFQLFSGIRYLHLKDNYNADYNITSDDTASVTNEHVNTNNQFYGAGPYLGAKVFYSLYRNFGISGQLAGNLIGGESRNYYTDVLFQDFEDDSPDTTINMTNNHHNSTLIVPGVSAKIALSYQVTFCNCRSFAIEAGFRGDKYFGLVNDSAFVEVLESPSEGFFIPTGGRQQLNKNANYQDFSVKGPYVNISFHI